MNPSHESILIKIALTLFFILAIGYAYFEARGLLFGPSITVPQALIETSQQYIDIKGQTAHIADLKMNGTSIPVTENGAFDQPYVLAPGHNRIVLDASDKYGKTTQRVIEIMYTPDASSTTAMHQPSTASTTKTGAAATSSPANTHTTAAHATSPAASTTPR